MSSKNQNIIEKIIDKLFSTTAAGFYMILFAFAIGLATFIENDFGTSSAQKVIFKANWFEILLLLFSICLVANIQRFRMIQNKKWAALLFHSAIIIIIAGAGITRYFSYEGMMHIREGSNSNVFLSSETFLQFEAKNNGNTYSFNEPVLFATLGNNRFRESYQVGTDIIDVEVTDFIPNPVMEMRDTKSGVPIIKLVIVGTSGREEHFLKEMDRLNINGTLFNFGNPEYPPAINIYFRNDSLIFKSPTDVTKMTMATQKTDTLTAGQYRPLMVRSLYSTPKTSFVFADFVPKGDLAYASTSPKMKSESKGAVELMIRSGNDQKKAYVIGNKGVRGRPEIIEVGNTQLTMAYGSVNISLPFAIQLHDFQMERYPGTNSASSYASEVTLLDPKKGVEKDFRIYMNNILNYGGYRFFQSSFDKDELGTYLSVNHDFWGTWVSYLGYALLTLGLIWIFFMKRSRFAALSKKLSKMRTPARSMATIALMLAPFFMLAEDASPSPRVIPQQHASNFADLAVQDHRGRLKPMHTLASEFLRKVSRKNALYDQSPEQILLGMMIYPDDWTRVPIIKLGRHETIKELLGTDGPLASYEAFFDKNGKYKLAESVRDAVNMQPIDRGKLEKELIKIDEKLNICNMVLNQRLMRLYSLANDPNNRWIAPGELARQQNEQAGSVTTFMTRFYPVYTAAVKEAVGNGDWKMADDLLNELTVYQSEAGEEVYPSDRKIKLEIWLNKLGVFSRLGKIYGLLGFGMLILFFASVFKPSLQLKTPVKIGMYLLSAAFAFHVLGLGLRWYISGHAPWSNGYESMIYIAFTTVLAGLIFSRKSSGGLAATGILASIILMVAGLSWMDPEITPLVPVLKSYWLTIHVSLEAGSYGFLMLGAIIGFVNLLLMIFLSKSNQSRVYRSINELTIVSEMTLIAGLVMVSIGTYLGGVWANESWGRYWGWDAKETWALVTILVYAFILHMRFIPGLRGPYAFNLASLFGFASVIMTYFGVNYYLSGLHSYAAGDPVPIPSQVYYTAAVFAIVGLLAFWRNRMITK